jgi:uncharacterized membrane protein
METNADLALSVLELIRILNIKSVSILLGTLKNMELTSCNILLETVHSSKGREAESVAVIEDWWDDVQLDNMRYVAYTRAKSELHIYPKWDN